MNQNDLMLIYGSTELDEREITNSQKLTTHPNIYEQIVKEKEKKYLTWNFC